MPTRDNPFLEYLDSHPAANAGALKQLFRMLAKRTHPDLGAENEAAFVRLQDAYNEAVTLLIRRVEDSRGTGGVRQDDSLGRAKTPVHEVWFPGTSRERILHFLYRYKTHLPSMNLDSKPVPPACLRAFANAREAAVAYNSESRYTLQQFDEQFHENRASLSRFPEVATKYRLLLQGLASFFDYVQMANQFNRRVVNSYLAELRPVTDFNPSADPQVRTNRSAAARSAMYRMRSWLEAEVELGPCRII